MENNRIKPILHLKFEDDFWLETLLKKDWRTFVLQGVDATFKAVGWGHASEISFLFANDPIIQKLNAQYRHKDIPTNVLSFPFLTFTKPCSPESFNDVILGDIVLSSTTVLKESIDYNKSFLDHTFHLMVHGTLHLLGFDHGNDHDAEQMEQVEISVLSDFNIANPYID